MFDIDRPLILASGSPRRKEILHTMGLAYTIDVPDVDETAFGSPEEMVIELSCRKAKAVAVRHENALILAADTLVYGKVVLGKPDTPESARDMLSGLSGNWHSVYTGLTLIDTANGRIISRAEMTRVHFMELSEREILDYIATKEPLDKAGAYGIQGMGGMFIDRIEGSYSNVVGLPMSMLRCMIKEITRT